VTFDRRIAMDRYRIKEYREKRGLSQRELEILSGISKQEISNIEVSRHVPRFSTLGKLSRVLHFDVDEIIDSDSCIPKLRIYIPVVIDISVPYLGILLAVAVRIYFLPIACTGFTRIRV